jgi:LysR family glycine cleavage system transcriptional activator
MKRPPGAPPPLPPLTALRAFECAARHASFTRAAEELGVTQTAVSHQVKLLEEHLGALLFRRQPRRVVLTRDGVAWAHALRDVFERLHEANARLRIRAREGRPMVAVSILPSFGARWLVPRLGRFLEQNPGLDVRLSPTEQLVDFGVEAMDLGVRYGGGDYPGLVTEKLADDALIVVCAPVLRAKRRLFAPEDLRRHVLLHDDARDAWPRWIDAQGLGGVDGRHGTELSDSSMLVEAAVRGHGVALARFSLAMDDLAAGRLITPFPDVPPMATGLAYYVVAPKENLSRAPVVRFRDWLKREARVLRSRSRSEPERQNRSLRTRA